MPATTTGLRYDPGATFEVAIRDLDYLTVDGVTLSATVFEPQGEGPFPLLIDVHGGGWRLFDRSRQRPIDQELASHGIVVASVDFRQAPPTETFRRVDGPHAAFPATFTDVNYAIRWFTAHAAEFNASAEHVGALGVSSGAHNVLINAMLGFAEPFRSRALPEAPDLKAELAYIICSGSPVDLVDMMVDANVTEAAAGIEVGELDFYGLHEYFGGVGGVTAMSPVHIAASRTDIRTPPLLLVHGDADDMGGVSTDRQFAFVDAYVKAGGTAELAVYPDAPHIFLNRGLAPESENLVRALAGIAGFIQRQLAYLTEPFSPDADPAAVTS